MNPVQRRQMKSTMRAIVPEFGPNGGNGRSIGERPDIRCLEAADSQEGGKQHRVNRSMPGVAKLSCDLLARDVERVNGTRCNVPAPAHSPEPEYRHDMSEQADDDKDYELRSGEHE